MNFKRYDTFQSLALIKDAWNQLVDESVSRVPFLAFEYLQAWWETRGGGEWPLDSELVLITATENDHLIGAAPLFFTKNLDGNPALMFVGAIEVSDFLDFLVRRSDLSEFLSGLLDFLENSTNLPPWEVLDLHNILEDSPTLPALEAEAQRRGWNHEQTRLQPSPFIPLPGDFDAYLAQIDKKQRHEIRRKLRNVEQSLAEPGSYIVTDAETLTAETQAFIDMMAQDPSKKEFLTEAMVEHLHKTAQVMFDKGWLHLSFFTLDGNKAAGNFSFIYNNRLWLYNSAWEWDYREFSPGWVLLTHLLQWANENGIEEFDFMRGDEDYKYKFGGQNRFIYRVLVTR
jgi:CelD/BcsL family acetyltransferase involved in cellulose biosynthesis